MFVFRLEHKVHGNGPLAGNNFLTACFFYEQLIDHKCPREFKEEGIDFELSELRNFGWQTLDLMKKYFKEGKKKNLHDTGFVVSVYEFSNNNFNSIFFPDGQVAFRKCDSILVEQIELKNLNKKRKYK